MILERKQDFHLNYKYSINYEYNCFSIVNSFLDLNKNLERTIVVKNRCNYITYEEFDKYKTRIGEYNHNSYENMQNIYTVYDIYGDISYKCKIFVREKGNSLFKIFDSYDHEINFDNKSF